MRWQVYIVFAFVAVVLDSSFMNVMRVTISNATFTPSLSATLVVFICLFASRLGAVAGCLLIGLLLDLALPPQTRLGGEAVHLVGPNALGLTFAGYLILQMRTMVFRQRALTIGVLTALCVLAAAVIAIAIYVIRSWYGADVAYPTQPSAFRELLRQIGIAVYSGLLAIPVGWVLLQTIPLWGFQAGHQRRVMR